MLKKEGWGGGENEFEIKFISKENSAKNYTKTNYNRNFGGIVITDKSENKKYFFERKKQYLAQQLYFLETGNSFLDESSRPLSFTIKDSNMPELVLQEFRTELEILCTGQI